MDAVADMRGRFIAAAVMIALVVGALHPGRAMGEVIAVVGSVDQSPPNDSMAADVPPAAASQAEAKPFSSPSFGDFIMIGAATLATALIIWKRWWRLNNAPRRPLVIQPPIALALYAGIIVLGQIGLQVARSAFQIPMPADGVDPSLTHMAQATLGFYGGELIGVLVFAYLMHHAPPRPRIGARPGLIKSLLIGVIALIVGYPIVSAVGGTAGMVESVIRGQPMDLIAHETLRQFVTSPVDGWYILMAALVIVGAAVAEEVLYRGLIQATMVELRINRWVAIICTSAFFSAMHATIVPPHALVALFALSLLFGWAYERTARLSTSMLMHGLFNAGNLLMALLTHA
jgi:membrane protease YdiL (CAAX protease family)